MEESVSSQEKDDISRWISAKLDEFGYSIRRRAVRIAHFDKWSAAKTLSTREIIKNDNINKVFVGSCREGIALFCESDKDILQINNEVKCVDTEHDTRVPGNNLIFQLVREKVPTGYALLSLCPNQSTHPYLKQIQTALALKDGQTYLSSEDYMKINEDVFYKNNSCIGRNTVYKARKGPSIPKYVKGDTLTLIGKWLYPHLNTDMDFVRAFPCSCPDLLQARCTRSRTGNWPSTETIQQVSQTQTYVVPVGQSGHETESLQWRISLIQAEICLVRSFNDTQAKVLILLRHISNHLLTPICADITSYVMKNVMFWMAESCSLESFQEKYLLDRLEDALRFLTRCIQERKLANYMIPNKNLFKGKLQVADQKAVLETVREITTKCTHFSLKVFCNGNLKTTYPNLQKLLINLELCNMIDMCDAIKEKHLTVENLANYNSFNFNCSSTWKYYVYHIYNVLLPVFWHCLFFLFCVPFWHCKWPLFSIIEKHLLEAEAISPFPFMSMTEASICPTALPTGSPAPDTDTPLEETASSALSSPMNLSSETEIHSPQSGTDVSAHTTSCEVTVSAIASSASDNTNTSSSTCVVPVSTNDKAQVETDIQVFPQILHQPGKHNHPPWKQSKSPRNRKARKARKQKKNHLRGQMYHTNRQMHVQIGHDEIDIEKIIECIMALLAALLLMYKVVRDELDLVKGIIMCVLFISSLFT